MDAYGLVLSEAAAMRFATAARSEQRQLVMVLDQVKGTPFKGGDLQESDSQGRTNEILVVNEWIVTYWADHASREMRVVRLERAGD